MKSTFLIATLLAAAAVAPTASAAHLSPDGALARLSSDRQHSPAVSGSATDMKLTATVGNLYVFSGSSGYLVLPNDDTAPALLGYSQEGTFDAATNPNLAYWLESLSAEVEFMAQNGLCAPARAARPERTSIAPMIATRWNQGEPYNNDCPEVSGTRCVTGCVATAMAQVLKYHSYPTKGTGVETYTAAKLGRELSFDYANTTFQWEAMTDTYTDASTAEAKAAVAELMYACGVGVHMNYYTNESGASSLLIPGALIDHFGYDKAGWLAQRDAYGIDEWEELIYNEIKENRPVLYGGQGSGGGHEFVCDGYSSDGFFHFNWGWGGMSDGYFLLTALNPGSLGTGGGAGGYNSGQDAVIGVQPAMEGSQPTYVIYNFEADFTAEKQSAQLGGSATFNGDFINYNYNSIPAFNFGIKIQPKDGGQPVYAQTGKYSGLEPQYYFSSFTVTIPSGLSAGEYTVTPAFRPENGEWHDVRTFITYTGYLDATVQGSTITFEKPADASVAVDAITLSTDIYIGRLTPLSFTVNNPGETEFLGQITPCLLNAQDAVVAMGDDIPLDLTAGESKAFDNIVTTFRVYQGADYSAGTYRLVFRDGKSTAVSSPVEVEVKADPGAPTISATTFELVSTTPVTNKASVKFNVGVRCTAGYYTGALRVVVFPYREGNVTSVYAGNTPYFFLSAGEDATRTADLDLSGLENGRYFAMLYSGSSALTNKQIIFELNQTQTGIETVEADAEPTEIIYDLNGMRRQRPLTPGLYIINGRKTAIR